MHSLSKAEAEILIQVARRIVPEVADLDEAGQTRFEMIIDRALGDRTAAVRRQFGVFLGLIRWAPVARWGSTFERLPATRQDAELAWLEDNPVEILRKGFWGLKTIVFMGYYGQAEVWPTIGYTPGLDPRDRRDG